MLKVTYLDSGLYLEHLQETVEDWLTLRVILAVRMGHRLVIERSTASLLLPINLVKRSNLEALACQEPNLFISPVDSEYLEVSLQGTWVCSDESGEGVFVTALNSTIETVLFNLWQVAAVGASSFIY
ncbi:MAG: alr0857 family protein [Leptolyngbya sp. IPPAS B-1204]|uniref:Uncharacterized protein n=1 Tax=Leptolyngbya sp. NK1-12 TaxID=2547451 RepID=A0AA96WNR0_9CYAN|nr:hypothetical protein [Elainella sp. C42_A2020_010]RNJ69721.1 MAG: hypothetical protein EDM05_07545 [Leptolyngbya sp. IPPAS B-1204]WNZ26016.1 hypothetical protein HJG54_26450 [Leptolyngbya sp. NK1-12]